MVLLTSKTGIHEKLSEPCELWLNHPGLKTVDGYHGFVGSVDSEFFIFIFIFLYLLAQPLLKLQPQTLRTNQHFFLFFFLVSLAPSLSAFLLTTVSTFYLSLRCSCLSFLHFPLVLHFFSFTI